MNISRLWLVTIFALLAIGLSPVAQASYCESAFLYSTFTSRAKLATDLKTKFGGTWARASEIEGNAMYGMYSLNTLTDTLKIIPFAEELENGKLDLGLRFISSDSSRYFFGSVNEGYDGDVKYGDFLFGSRNSQATLEKETFDGKTLKKIRFSAAGPKLPFSAMIPARLWQHIHPSSKETVTITTSEDGNELVIETKVTNQYVKDAVGRVVYRRVSP